MQVANLKNKKIVIWGYGNEGKAAAAYIRKALPTQRLIFVDEAEGNGTEQLPENSLMVSGPGKIDSTLDDADIVIKSPGVSLYHPAIKRLHKKGVPVTSLLNLWLGEPHAAKTICITGTKGKSTTSSLLAHVLKGLGKKAAVGGNIGVPVTEIPPDVGYAVIEVSSFQAANLEGACDIAILTSLYPEHLDWHGSAETYIADKLRLLTHAKTKIVNESAFYTVRTHGIGGDHMLVFNQPHGLHVNNDKIYDGEQLIGGLTNAHLSRAHNLSNACAVLTVIKFLGLDMHAALAAMESYQGLPHRQQELGEKNGVLYVNDSIATTPHASIAALEVYHGRPITLIAGGYDRGVDYEPLISHIIRERLNAIICLGPSGKRIHDELVERHINKNLFTAESMKEVIQIAKKNTPKGGVILLSPGAPSFGLFRDYADRGKQFAKEAGF